MRIRTIRARRDAPLLDIASLARHGPAGRVWLSRAQVEQIARTVARAPEVLVKVTRGATSTAGVIAHLCYIDRNGELDIETDEGERRRSGRAPASGNGKRNVLDEPTHQSDS